MQGVINIPTGFLRTFQHVAEKFRVVAFLVAAYARVGGTIRSSGWWETDVFGHVLMPFPHIYTCHRYVKTLFT
jgi:hypothetical protein